MKETPTNPEETIKTTARWTGKPDRYVGLEVGTIGEVRSQGAENFGGASYSAIFTWSIPGYEDVEEVYCTSDDYKEAV